MGSQSVKAIEGFASRGGELPWVDPHAIKIVGLDLEQTADNWFAVCPRADEPIEEDFIDDVRRNGVRVAVDVYKDGNTVVMLDGRRRVRAARMVRDEQAKAKVPLDQRITVRVNIRSGDPIHLFTHNVGSENRKPRSAMQRASLMLHAKNHGVTEDAIAQMFGVTAQVVKYTLKLHDLAADVQRAVDSGTLPVREAVKLADKPREEQKKILSALVAADATRGARASNGIAAAKKGKEVKADARKMRSRSLLEGWVDNLEQEKKKYQVDLVEVLKFVLGGALPPDLDDKVSSALIQAGFEKGKKKKKEA